MMAIDNIKGNTNSNHISLFVSAMGWVLCSNALSGSFHLILKNT